MITKKEQGGAKPPFPDAGLESGRRLIFEQGNVMSHHFPAFAQWDNNMGLGKEKRKVKVERTIYLMQVSLLTISLPWGEHMAIEEGFHGAKGRCQ